MFRECPPRRTKLKTPVFKKIPCISFVMPG